MFTDTALSCCLLVLASGCCTYLTGKWSINKFSMLQLDVVAASVGVLAINLRSVSSLLSPFYFYDTYSIDPIQVEEESDEKVKLRSTPFLDKVCRIFSMGGFTFAVCSAHRCHLTGIILTSTLVSAETYHAKHSRSINYSEEIIFHCLWIIGGGLFGWLKGNHFCTLACVPYYIAFLALAPNRNYPWSAKQMINNYMMMAYIILMLEALREARSIS